MRIQHNIPAMNAYQKYNRNTKALSKNLEKLSSGYRINRAGDDAAGLAISEKMRAQITGLEVAQKNAKDGISLVQTAEGGMEEVHDMLNRMYSLAEQSRNGTYQDAVDREQMQKEITSLKEEINRISESVNFNGIKLLDGSLNGGAVSVSDNITVKNDEAATTTLAAGAGRTAGTAGITSTKAFTGITGGTDGTKYSYVIDWTKDDGTTAQAKAEFEWTGSGSILMGTTGTASAGYTKTGLAGGAGNASATELAEVVKACLDKDATFKGEVTVTDNGDGTLSFASVGGKNSKITKITPSTGLGGDGIAPTNNTGDGGNTTPTPNADKGTQTMDLSGIEVMDGAALDKDKIEKNTFEIGGKKFLLVNGAVDSTKADLIASDITIIKTTDTAGAAYAGGDNEAVATELARVTGLTLTGQDGEATISNEYNSASERLAETEKDADGNVIAKNQGLSLQIGDTAEEFNQMTVKIMSVHTKALGIDGIDVGTQAGAAKAMDLIKDAINKVSGGRGDLGALQNRLDHTINNLATMHENIQDAEATIRDVDVAEEMMAYTKNNILVQSAQAMLAQANQLPQGVLQLLQ